MASLALTLLGFPRVERDAAPVRIERRKALALLIYLAVTRQPQSRDLLAALFWPDYDPHHARANLRRACFTLDQALGSGWLDRTPETISLHHAVGLRIDVEQFHELLAQSATHAHPSTDVCRACLPAVLSALVALASHHDERQHAQVE